MTAMSNYLEGSLIGLIFQNTAFTTPSTLAIALCTSVPTDVSTGALTGCECTGSGYARVSGSGTTNPSSANWASPSAGNGTTSNNQVITFPTATGSWGTIVGVAITDNATTGSGNCLFFGSLVEAKVVGISDTFVFAAGALQVQIDN